MIFQPPSEIEFFERGFGLSPEHDPDEAVISFVREWPSGMELIVTFKISGISTAYARVADGGRVIAEATLEGVVGVSFQSWNGEQILRMSFDSQRTDLDMKVSYEPDPRIQVSALAK